MFKRPIFTLLILVLFSSIYAHYYFSQRHEDRIPSVDKSTNYQIKQVPNQSLKAEIKSRPDSSSKVLDSNANSANIIRSGHPEGVDHLLKIPDRIDLSGSFSDDGNQANLTPSETHSTTSFNGWIGSDLGESLKGQEIRIASRGMMNQEHFTYTASSDENGKFSFEGIRADTLYELEVYPTSGYSNFVIARLLVSSYMPPLNIALDTLQFVDVTGMIVDGEGTAISDFEIVAKNITTGRHVEEFASDSSGFFRIEYFPLGEVNFLTKPPNYFNITGMHLSNENYHNLVLTVDWGRYYLSGWVSDKNGAAVVGARVNLDGEIVKDGTKSFSYRSKMTDSTGTFSFGDVGSKKHVITVYAMGFVTQEIQHQFHSSASEVNIVLSRP
jgi:hypothetical protein